MRHLRIAAAVISFAFAAAAPACAQSSLNWNAFSSNGALRVESVFARLSSFFLAMFGNTDPSHAFFGNTDPSHAFFGNTDPTHAYYYKY